MKHILVGGGHMLLALAALAAATTSVAPTQVESVMYRGDSQRTSDIYREASLRDIYEGEPVLQWGDEPIAPARNPTVQEVITIEAREEDFHYYRPVKKHRNRYNRKKLRAQRNGWRC